MRRCVCARTFPSSRPPPFALVEEGKGRRILSQAIEVDGRDYRRVRVELDAPTRDGDRPIDMLTDLPPEVDAATAANIYRRRWCLETVFQRV
jgi:hypothetical protein